MANTPVPSPAAPKRRGWLRLIAWALGYRPDGGAFQGAGWIMSIVGAVWVGVGSTVPSAQAVGPIMTGLVISALSGVDKSISDTLVSLGATGYQKILEILREARFAILGAVVLGFGRAIAEVGVAMMIGGNIRGFTRVLTTAITLETGMGAFGLSIALGIILLIIALIVVVSLNLITAGLSAESQMIMGGPRG